MKVQKSFKPGKKWFKSMVSKIVFFILGRAFQVFSKKDHKISEEIESWPEGFKLMLDIMPFGPELVLQKNQGKIFARNFDGKTPDLSIKFKNIESAFMILTPQMGVPQGFAEHRFILIGDVAKAMSFTRCLNIILTYLYPDFICKNLMRRIPEINISKRILKRAYFYTIGMIAGF